MTDRSVRTAYRRLFLLMLAVFLMGAALVALVLTGAVRAEPIVRPVLWVGWLLVLMAFPLLFVTGYWWAKADQRN